MRRDLPLGGEAPREYHVVDENGSDVTLEDPFRDHEVARLDRPSCVQRRDRRLHAGLRLCRRCRHAGVTTVRPQRRLDPALLERRDGDMADPGQDPRGLEMDPLWTVLDTTPLALTDPAKRGKAHDGAGSEASTGPHLTPSNSPCVRRCPRSTPGGGKYVSKGGLEPPRDCSHQPLKLARLPISPLRLVGYRGYPSLSYGPTGNPARRP